MASLFKRPGPPVRIETDRFVQATVGRRWLARRTFAWSRDAEIMDPMGYPHGTWKARRWRRHFHRPDNRRRFLFGVFDRADGRLIGYQTVAIGGAQDAHVGVNIGEKAYWGQGVVQEIRAALIDYLFGTLEVEKVTGTTSARNFPSIFNYQALGFQNDGVLRRHRRGQDWLIFSQLREEWQARQGGADGDG